MSEEMFTFVCHVKLGGSARNMMDVKRLWCI